MIRLAPSTRHVWSSCAASCLAASLAAQVSVAPMGKLHLPRDGARTDGIAFGDVNGDGAVDVVTSTNLAPGDVRIYIQGPGVVFAPARVHRGTLTARPVLADLDGDRDLDLLLGGSGFSAAGILLNDGQGNFARGGRLPILNGIIRVAASGDVDADGDLDLAVGGERGSPAKLWRNDGNAGFTDAPPPRCRRQRRTAASWSSSTSTATVTSTCS